MAYKNLDGLSGTAGQSNAQTLEINGATVKLPDPSYVRDAVIQRDGMDLVLDGPQGTITIDGYFAAADAPDLIAPNGETLTPELVNSFARSAPEFAQAQTLNDASPVGAVSEITGEATITRMDGSTEPLTMGTQVYQGDVIETAADGAVNISFIDDTSFAVSEEARLAIDEYVYDPSTQAGSQNFSVLKGVFVFTSGLIGRDDPDDVNIDTPSGSIGIRGTIIAGNVDTGEITVVEGAIVVRDLGGNEMTLATQFETAKIDPAGGIENMGRLPANDVTNRFVGVSKVSPTLFSSINDAAAEQNAPEAPSIDEPAERPTNDIRENFDADGTVDGDGDSEVDGTVDEGGESAGDTGAPAPVDGAADDAPVEEGMQPRAEMKPGALGMDTMGTNNAGMNAPMQGMAEGGMNMGGMMAAGMEAANADTMGGMMETLAEMQDMQPENMMGDTLGDLPPPLGANTLPPPPPPGVLNPNNAPISLRGSVQHSTAPQDFFVTSFQQSIDYHFDKEFRDPDGDALTYRLDAGTVSNLTGLYGAKGTGWDFNQSNGRLEIFDTLSSAVNSQIRIEAIDSNGASSGFNTYNFDVNPGTVGTLPGVITSTGQTLSSPGAGGETVTIGPGGFADNNWIYAGDGADNITINQGNGNHVYLGSGNNIATISGANANVGNKIFGGFGSDMINLGDVKNKVYGMDGNDTIKIDLTTGTTKADLETFGNNNIRIDGGFNNAINVGNPNGQGDTLELAGTTGNLDFTAVDNAYIRGIERIDLSTGNHTVTLGLNDVVAMTDHHNTLIIRADTGDTLNFVAGDFAGFTNQGTQILDDDAASAATTNFDVYTQGNVTLLVENTGATVNGLP